MLTSGAIASHWRNRKRCFPERLRSKNAACGWMLYMDSTAFVQNHQVSLSRYLDDLFKDQPMNLRTGGIFQWDARRSGMVSDKIFFIQANGHGEELMNAWRSSSSEDEAMSFEAAEQGTLTELLFPGKVATRSAKAMKLFQVSHAKIHGSEQLRGKATVLFSAGTEGQCWGDFIQDTSLAPEAVKKKRSLEQLRRIGLVGARFNERLPALSAAMRGWKVPTWTAGMAGHQALISQKVKVQVKEENLEAEEKEILAELGESEE
mmetsp:Transcript_55686/g.121866  ORF Transcript_55686/g.121866 Transcript_55686/m.121866 type:complete len:262 (+) Transcript_55686:292-1077(+)